MAVGNAIVTTAKFKPLTIAEWAAPLKEYAEQHQAAEEALVDLSDKASEYERYIRENPNSDIARQYNSYIDEIENQTNNLIQYGMNPQTRTDLLQLRRAYSKSIKPIKNAVLTYQDIMAQRNKDINKGIIGAPDIDVNYLINHPEYTTTQDRNSYKLGTDVYNKAKSLFKNLTNFNKTPRQYSNGISLITEIPQGYSSEEIQTLFLDEDNPNLSPELRDTWKRLKAEEGFEDLTPDQQELFIYYTLQGALSNVKPPKISTRALPNVTTKKGKDPKNLGERGQTNPVNDGLVSNVKKIINHKKEK